MLTPQQEKELTRTVKAGLGKEWTITIKESECGPPSEARHPDGGPVIAGGWCIDSEHKAVILLMDRFDWMESALIVAIDAHHSHNSQQRHYQRR